MHEIYFPGFRAAVGTGGAASVMCSCNRINGTQACQDPNVLGALRSFGLQGFVEPDATLAVRDVLAAARARVDNFRLGSIASAAAGAVGAQAAAETKVLGDAVASGDLERSVVDRGARNILIAMDRVGLLDHPAVARQASPSTAAHRRLATAISTQAAVPGAQQAPLVPIPDTNAGSARCVQRDRRGAGRTASPCPRRRRSPPSTRRTGHRPCCRDVR